jgi:anti-sigma factor RsiW
MEDEWRQHPPVHHLAAAYLEYKPPPAEVQDAEESEDSTAGRPQWLSGMGTSMPAPEGLATAATPAAALAALERLFFGEVNGL